MSVPLREVKSANDEGMDPVREFFSRPKFFNDVSWPISAGIVPVKPQFCMANKVADRSCPISEGNLGERTPGFDAP